MVRRCFDIELCSVVAEPCGPVAHPHTLLAFILLLVTTEVGHVGGLPPTHNINVETIIGNSEKKCPPPPPPPSLIEPFSELAHPLPKSIHLHRAHGFAWFWVQVYRMNDLTSQIAFEEVELSWTFSLSPLDHAPHTAWYAYLFIWLTSQESQGRIQNFQIEGAQMIMCMQCILVIIYPRDRTNVVRLMYVHLPSLAITCRNPP